MTRQELLEKLRKLCGRNFVELQEEENCVIWKFKGDSVTMSADDFTANLMYECCLDILSEKYLAKSK